MRLEGRQAVPEKPECAPKLDEGCSQVAGNSYGLPALEKWSIHERIPEGLSGRIQVVLLIMRPKKQSLALITARGKRLTCVARCAPALMLYTQS